MTSMKLCVYVLTGGFTVYASETFAVTHNHKQQPIMMPIINSSVQTDPWSAIQHQIVPKSMHRNLYLAQKTLTFIL